jgi:hypothetical protein
MQEDAEDHGQQGHSEHTEEDNIKKHLDAKGPEPEEEDYELHEKKDRPPRFSTLFGGSPPPQIVERYIEQPKKKRSGVYIPLPLFIVLAIILFFESTLLFAYTIIALDNNLPSGLFPIGSSTSTRLDGCSCAQQPAINVAPKFFMGPSQVANKAPSLPDAHSTTTTSKTSSTSSTTKPTAKGTAHTSVVVTVTPTPVAKTSVINLTVDENGSTISPTKVTSFTTIPAPSGGSKKRASVQSALESIISAKSSEGGKGAPTPTTLGTTKSPTKNDVATTSSAGGGMPCFGGSGAVGLVCPDGVGNNGGKV